MRILNEQDEELTLDQCNLETGNLREEIIIWPDAVPIDNVTKFAWSDADYEEILRYIEVPEMKRNEYCIEELKKNLKDTDYTVIKIAEGAATKEEYSIIISNREAWHKEINDLQANVARLKQEETK